MNGSEISKDYQNISCERDGIRGACFVLEGIADNKMDLVSTIRLVIEQAFENKPLYTTLTLCRYLQHALSIPIVIKIKNYHSNSSTNNMRFIGTNTWDFSDAELNYSLKETEELLKVARTIDISSIPSKSQITVEVSHNIRCTYCE